MTLEEAMPLYGRRVIVTCQGGRKFRGRFDGYEDIASHNEGEPDGINVMSPEGTLWYLTMPEIVAMEEA